MVFRLGSLVAFLAFGYGCSSPDCIDCLESETYPSAIICREAYETTTQAESMSWREYTSEGLRSGCRERNP
jgi:hypothetical protein